MDNFFLIGLTGNLASGKSTVRRHLERLGASGLDADALAHLAMRRGSPVWFSLVKTFGFDILTFTGKIDRRKLGARVFSQPDALRQLEALTHPAVRELFKDWLRHVATPIVVVEAIKLVESGMHEWCDALWVVQAKPETQIERAARDRQMSVDEARARLAAQGSLDAKLRMASVVIDNNGDEKFTRAQVERAWAAINPTLARDKRAWLHGAPVAPSPAPVSVAPVEPPVIVAPSPAPAPVAEPVAPPVIVAPSPAPAPAPVAEPVAPPVVVAPSPAPAPVVEPSAPAWATTAPSEPAPVVESSAPAWSVAPPTVTGAIEVRRARRSDLVALGVALGKRENSTAPLSNEQALKRFGERGYRIALCDGRVIALAAWEAENLVALMRETWAESADAAERALPQLFDLVEQDARGLLCEVSVILLEASAAAFTGAHARAHGYAVREINALHRLWIPVVQERLRPGDQILAKQLREELITKPV